MSKISVAKEYRYRIGGKARVLTTDRPCHDPWTVVSMSTQGTINIHDAYGKSQQHSNGDLIEVGKWDAFQKYQIVEVRRGCGGWKLRRFSGVFEGKPMAYPEQGEGDTPKIWDECRVPDGPPYLE